ncbi:MAG: hypothetical protein HYV07_16510 [Deltaproteobacteria bacterium]|nr:hypothetical protein [Deltaproteobacteria bacterium]
MSRSGRILAAPRQGSLRAGRVFFAVLLSCGLGTTALADDPTASVSSSTVAQSGPELELDGLELDGTPSRPEREEPPSENERKPDLLDNLVERTSAIIDKTRLGGYGEHELHVGGGDIAHFQNHRFVLFVYSQLHERISAATEIELEFAGSPLKKGGALEAGEVLLEFAVIDLKLFEWLVFRAGVILVPVSTLNLRHDAPTWDLTDRPIAYTSVVPSTWFESGAGVLGKISSGDHRLTYELYAINGLDARIFDGLGYRGARGSNLEDNNHDKGITGRIAYSPNLGLELGLSGYTGIYDLSGNRATLGNVDLMLRSGRFELLAEAVLARNDPGFVEGFSTSSANTRSAIPETMWGFYVQANVHFTIPPLFELFPDWLSEAVLTGVLRYEGMDTDTDHFTSAGDRRRLTLGLNFRPIEPYVLKTNFQLDTNGISGSRSAPDVFSGAFWMDATFGFAASVAYLF